MLFTTKNRKKNESLSIKIGDETINRVSHTKFLGIWIDDKLNWSHHIANAKNKISKGLGILWRAKRLLLEKTMVTLYYSFIYPYLHYGITAWGKSSHCYLDPLKKLQKRAIRFISSASRFAHTHPIFKRLNLLKLDEIFVLNVMMFMFNFKHYLLPQVFNDMFLLNSSVHSHSTRQQNMYHNLPWRLQIRSKSIRIQGTLIWNKLIQNFDYNCSYATFKFHVRKYLLENNITI